MSQVYGIPSELSAFTRPTLPRRGRGRGRGEAVAWSRDGSRLAVGGIDGAVRLLDAVSLRELAGLRGHAARVTSLVFGPDDECLISGSRDGTVRVWAVPAAAVN